MPFPIIPFLASASGTLWYLTVRHSRRRNRGGFGKGVVAAAVQFHDAIGWEIGRNQQSGDILADVFCGNELHRQITPERRGKYSRFRLLDESHALDKVFHEEPGAQMHDLVQIQRIDPFSIIGRAEHVPIFLRWALSPLSRTTRRRFALAIASMSRELTARSNRWRSDAWTSKGIIT